MRVVVLSSKVCKTGLDAAENGGRVSAEGAAGGARRQPDTLALGCYRPNRTMSFHSSCETSVKLLWFYYESVLKVAL